MRNLAFNCSAWVGMGPGVFLLAALLAAPAGAVPFNTIFERDPDQISLGDDIFYTNYDSFQDLIDNNASSFGLTQIGLGTPTSLSVGGVAFDGSQYHVLFERDPDEIVLGDDVF